MLSIDSIKTKLGGQLAQVESIGDAVIRGVRTREGAPISVYYFDLSEKLEEIAPNLKSYQDKFISKNFFANPGALQWNYYLIFLLSKEKFKTFKQSPIAPQIEKDKLFTRKLIVSEDELDSIITLPILTPVVNDEPARDLSTRWIERLDESGLSGIYSKQPRTEVIRQYISGSAFEHQPDQSSDFSSEVNSRGRRLSDLNLIKYRPFPKKREFSFGSMNLFVGANGTGKTSLLEAIELVYCGGTLRGDGKVDPNLSIHFKFDSDAEFDSVDLKGNKKYQQRDLLWYGRSITKGNDLCSSFNKYNFYNADSAYKLANNTDDEEIDSAFSALALGERANFIDKRLHDFKGDFEDRLSAQKKKVEQLNETVRLENEKIGRIEKLERNSSTLFQVFRESALTLNFVMPIPGDTSSLIEAFSPQLIETKNLFENLSKGEKLVSPLTKINLENRFGEYQRICSEITNLRSEFETLKTAILANENQKTAQKSGIDLAKQLINYFEEGRHKKLVGAADSLKKKELLLSFLRGLKTQRDQISPKDLEAIDLSKSLEPEMATIQGFLASTQTDLVTLEQQYARLRDKWSSTNRILSEIRSLAAHLVDHQPEIRDCPICSHAYKVGELKTMIEKSVSGSETQDLTEQKVRIDSLKEELIKASDRLNLFKRIQALIGYAKTQFTISEGHIKESLEAIDRLFDLLPKYEREFSSLREEVAGLSAMGLTESHFVKLKQQAAVIFENSSLESITDIKSILQDYEKTLEDLLKAEAEATEKLNTISKKRLELGGSVLSLDQVGKFDFESQIFSDRSQLQFAVEAVRAIGKTISLGDNDDLILKRNKILNLVNQLESLADTRRQEQLNEIELKSAKKVVSEVAKNADAENKSLERLIKANEALADLISNDSKEKALSSFIDKNRSRINDIFTRIHSPHEFEGLVPGTTKLKRIGESAPTSLHHVSTGQRSALALSVFFALNLTLKNAPPVILVDDPVAHVDDLNTLSFLDFLRELVAQSERQVFFATASQKLANLIEKKFSFLGEKEFKRFEFSR